MRRKNILVQTAVPYLLDGRYSKNTRMEHMGLTIKALTFVLSVES